MGGTINGFNQTTTWGNQYNFNFNLNLGGSSQLDATNALSTLSQFFMRDQMVRGGGWGGWGGQAFRCAAACLRRRSDFRALPRAVACRRTRRAGPRAA